MPVSIVGKPKKTGRAKNTKLSARTPENRRERLLEAAAELFATKGYAGTSVRGIASAVGMLSGSVYYHFSSKEQILLTVYDQGVERFLAAIKSASAEASEGGWPRLEAACVGHLTVLLEGGPFTRMGKAEFIQSVPDKVARKLIEQRDRYEMEFDKIIADLPLKNDIDRFYLRVFLLGGLMSALNWYRPGKSGPAEIASSFVGFVRDGVEQV